jgi:hypothetical protein
MPVWFDLASFSSDALIGQVYTHMIMASLLYW